MENQQEFWNYLERKYERKNDALRQKELELRHRLGAMDTIIDRYHTKPSSSSVPATEVVRKHSFNCPPSERVGFFKCVMTSLFGSSPTKTAPPPLSTVPEEVARDQVNASRDQLTTNRGYKNPNCMCNPCQADAESYKNPDCVCNPCQADVESVILAPQKHPSGDKGDVCNCSICGSYSDFLAQKKALCCCNFLDLPEGVPKCDDNNNTVQKPKPIEPTASKYGDNTVQKLKPMSGFNIPTNASLNSMDLNYMKTIHDLATHNKDLSKQVDNMEQKARIYDQVFREYQNVNLQAQQPAPCKPDPCKAEDPQDSKLNAELQLENLLLKTELKDMRLEVRQYLEKMEGPMQYKIESERYKYAQLEKKLEEAAREFACNAAAYKKDMNDLKMELYTANASIYNLTAENEQLKEKLKATEQKIGELEDKLLFQKIIEAETIMKLQALLEAQNNVVVKESECNLHQIARELSKVLKECEPCGECMSLPEDLTTAAKLLKSLTDMIDRKLPPDDGETSATKPSIKKETKPKPSPPIEPDECVSECKAESTLNAAAPESKPGNVSPAGGSPQKDAASAEVEPAALAREKSASIRSKNEDVEGGAEITVTSSPKLPTKVGSKTREKTSCVCVKPRKQAGERREPCDCGVARKLKEQSKGMCKCSRERVPPVIVEEKIEEKVEEPTEKCECKEPAKEVVIEEIPEEKEPEPAKEDSVDKIWTAPSERFKLSHQVTASKSKDILKSATSVKCLKVKENFPFDVDTQVDVLNRPPDGVHVTTTITNSGTLEVITEGPEGVIDTTLIYTNSGNVEVVTEILHYQTKGGVKAITASDFKAAIEASDLKTGIDASDLKTTTSEPAKTTEGPTDVKQSSTNPDCTCRECPLLTDAEKCFCPPVTTSPQKVEEGAGEAEGDKKELSTTGEPPETPQETKPSEETGAAAEAEKISETGEPKETPAPEKVEEVSATEETTATTEKVEELPATEGPTDTPTTEKVEEVSATQEPSATAASEKVEEVPASEQPSDTPTSEKIEEVPVTEEPKDTPAAAEVDEAPQSQQVANEEPSTEAPTPESIVETANTVVEAVENDPKVVKSLSLSVHVEEEDVQDS